VKEKLESGRVIDFCVLAFFLLSPFIHPRAAQIGALVVITAGCTWFVGRADIDRD
jgi:hypothetical protein